jgi:hypothetical protein
MTRKPSYRFVGHTEPWEEKKLGEVTSDLKSGLSRMLANEDIGLPVIRANNINDGYLDLSNDIKYWYEVDPQGSNTNNYVVEENDILINFINSEAKMGTSAIVRFPLDRKTIYTTNILRLRVSEGISSNFIFYIFSISRYINFIKSITKPAVNQSSFTTVDFKKFIIFLPSLPEQTAIGSFFQDIDQLISLQQRKLEVLKEQKKTYLKLLFPAKGQTKPALRFAGFEDEWKEVKVSDIFRVTRGQVLATTEISEEKTDTHKYPVYSSQTKNEGLLGYYDKYLFETAITWTTDGANAGTVNYREGKFYSTNVNGVLLSDEGFANKVVAEILNNEAWKYVSKVGNPKLMNNVMSEISLVIPNDFREISILSTFFQDLDKAIAKQEEKVNQLKESKQTLLRKMFI